MSTDLPPRVAVVGAGTLGPTVAHAALAAGSSVVLLVRGDEDRCRQRAVELTAAIRRQAARAGLPDERTARLLGSLAVTSDLEDLAGADVAVESVPESAPLKREVIAAIEDVVAEDTLIASTTSSIPASALAAGARHPERVVVAHYVWPAHLIPLVEVALHDRTAPAAVRRLDDLLAGQGKRQVRVADRPGFLITRVLFAYWDAALQLVVDGCPPAAVDDALTRFGWPMGPLAVLEATGLPSVRRIHDDLAPHLTVTFPALAALGTAVGAGATRIFGEQRRIDQRLDALLRCGDAGRDAGPEEIVDRTVGALADAVDRAVGEGVVGSWEEAGAAVDAAYGFPRARGGLGRWWVDTGGGRTRAEAGNPSRQ